MQTPKFLIVAPHMLPPAKCRPGGRPPSPTRLSAAIGSGNLFSYSPDNHRWITAVDMWLETATGNRNIPSQGRVIQTLMLHVTTAP